MDDDWLERRLRRDPTMDPPHRVGAFRDRLADRGLQEPNSRGRLEVRAGGSLAIAATVLVAVVLILGRAVGPSQVPGAVLRTDSEAPSQSNDGLPSERLQAALIEWAHRGAVHRATLAVIGPKGETWTGSSIAPGEPDLDPLSTYRIGEMSQMPLVSAVLSLDECGRGLGSATCVAPSVDPPFSIDDRLSRWIPDWPNGDAIRIRQLLDGTSGLAPVTSGMADLLARVTAEPAADWTESGLIARARAVPPSFSPGKGFAVTDTANLLLDDIVARATGRESLFWIGSSTTEHFGLVSTTLPNEPPRDLVRGTLADGSRLDDLPPAVLTAVGNASGAASNVLDLARFANPAWSSSSVHDASTITAATAVANANSYGLGVRGFCPCSVGRATVLGLTGHAAAWSGIVAKDTVGGWAIALFIDADVPDADLEAALDIVLATRP
jgi:D-alanyl-D-alanine carboxypeptidase